MRIPFRLVVAFVVAAALTILLTLYLSRTFMGRAIRAVAQDQEALRLMGANPIRIKQWAFGIATAVLGIAGALLIIVAPVEPTLDRTYIGRTFCVVVMAGLGSMSGTLVAAHHPRRRRNHRAHPVRRLLGAGHFLCDAARRARRPAAGPVRQAIMKRNGIYFWIGAALFLGGAAADDAGHRQPVSVLCRLRDPAVHRARGRPGASSAAMPAT